MRSFLKFPAGWLVAALVIGTLAGGAFAQKKSEEKPKAKDKKKTGEKGGKDGQPKEPGKLEIPVSKDHDAKGLKIPYFDSDGKKQMIFTIGVASRLDDEHIGMTETQIETFDENGDHEMLINLPKSRLNANTGVILTEKRVVIKRVDFEITGQTMEFNMKTKRGTLGGGVRMLVYNIEDELPDAPKAKTPESKSP